MSYAQIVDALGQSTSIPATWHAHPAQVTPSGAPALFRSNSHAVMALRVLFLESSAVPAEELAHVVLRYRRGWARFVKNCNDMRTLVALLDADEVGAAAACWNTLDQTAADDAFRIVLGEREPLGGSSVAAGARKHFGLVTPSVPGVAHDRSLRPADHDEAWDRSLGGVCRGCGTPTISHAQRRRLHAAMKTPEHEFDIAQTYVQHNKKPGPLWENVTIAARGVAEHVKPWSQGGMTDISNLTNTCAGCNYARSDMSMDEAGVADYDRPASEIEAAAGHAPS